MITFFTSLFVLIGGYALYSKFIESKVFGVDPNRSTPATTKADGVDFIILPWWRIFLIQF